MKRLTKRQSAIDESLPSKVGQDELMKKAQDIFSRTICNELLAQSPSTVRARLPTSVLCACVLYFVLARLRSFSEVAVSLEVQLEDISWKQLFESFDLYYREAAGRTDLSAIEWILKHHESLGILKPPRKSERKVQDVPAQVQEVYQQEYPAMPTTLQPRKARYAQRKCGRGIHRNIPTTEKKRIIGRVKKQKAPKVSQDKKKKQPKTKTPRTSISSPKPELLLKSPGTPSISIPLEEPTCSTP